MQVSLVWPKHVFHILCTLYKDRCGRPVQKPVTSALQRIAAAKIATSWVNQAAALQEQSDASAYGALPEPNPPSEQLALAVKKQIKEEMEQVPQKLHGRRLLGAREGGCGPAVGKSASECETAEASAMLPPLLDSARSLRKVKLARQISFSVHKVVSLEDVVPEVWNATRCLKLLVGEFLASTCLLARTDRKEGTYHHHSIACHAGQQLVRHRQHRPPPRWQQAVGEECSVPPPLPHSHAADCHLSR
jgi:hypothetical protein